MSELKKNKYLILVLAVLIVFVILTPVVYKSLSNNESNINKETNSNSSNNNIKNEVQDKDNNDSNNNNNSSNSSDNNETKPENNNNNNTNDNNTSSSNEKTPNQRKEEDVVSYFESTERMITTYSNVEDKAKITDKLKSGFTTIVDFLFYDKEIKGYTFKELTLATKLKICQIALSIDKKIDSYFPDYKQTIKNGFDSLKAKVVIMYLELTNKACEMVGSATCNQARADFKNMKEILKIDWEFIKGVAGSSKEAISEWYQSFK